MRNSFSIAFIGIAHYADGHHCDGDNDHKEEDEEDNQGICKRRRGDFLTWFSCLGEAQGCTLEDPGGIQ